MKNIQKPSKRLFLLIALSTTGLVGTSIAADSHVRQDKAAASADMSAELTRSEKKFLAKAYECNQQEIALSKLAADRATNPQVREYAKELSNEHSKVDMALQQIVTERKARLETDEIDLKANDLAKKSGQDFDEAYLEEIVENHKDAVDLYEDAAEDNKNPQIRTFAATTLPTLRDHLVRAKQLERAVD